MAQGAKVTEFREATLSKDDIENGIIRLKKRIVALEAFNPQTVTKQYDTPELDALGASIDDALLRTFGADSHDYRRYRSAAKFDSGPINVMYDVPIHLVRDAVSSSKAKNLALLHQAVDSLNERSEELDSRITKACPKSTSSRKIFVVHGHDDAAKEALARFLEKIGLEAVILHEQPDQGRTIIEKFEQCADDVGFAVVLLTPDDQGAAKLSGNQNARARQNVIFELGYFAGKLGRGRSCLLRKGDVEMPSDLAGVIYCDLDQNEGWKMKLAKEMRAAGLSFDADKVFE